METAVQPEPELLDLAMLLVQPDELKMLIEEEQLWLACFHRYSPSLSHLAVY